MRALTIGWAVFILLSAGTAGVEAQAIATSFDQLAVVVTAGDKVSVIDDTGGETEGRIGAVSRDALTLMTAAGPRVLGVAEVVRVRQRRSDSLMNGLIIGAIAGTAYFATAAALLKDSDGGDVIVSTAVLGGVLFAGAGAAAGAGIDALIARRQVIYEKPASGSRVSVAPIVGRGRRGVSLSVRF
jgi:hypothetical protein